MATSLRPRRSVLYMPGSNARALEKAKTLPADAPDPRPRGRRGARRQGDRARARSCAAVKAGGYGQRELVIRINGLDTPWGAADLDAAAAAGARRHPGAQGRPRRRLVARRARRWPRPARRTTTRLWAMIETPLAILNAAGDRRRRARAGRAARLLRDGHQRPRQGDARRACAPDRAPMLPWLSAAVAAARAYGLDVARRRLQRLRGRRRLRARVRARPRARLRRQDADPSRPGRRRQRGVRAVRRRGGVRRARSSPPSSAGEPGQGRASRSTAAWSSCCTPRWRAAPSRSPRPSRAREGT